MDIGHSRVEIEVGCITRHQMATTLEEGRLDKFRDTLLEYRAVRQSMHSFV
jgi:hypothetical protein